MRVVLLLVGIGCIASAVASQVATEPETRVVEPGTQERYTYFGEKQGDTVVRKRSVLTLRNDVLLRTPKWTEKSPNPPVSAREAIEKAEVVRKQMLKDDDQWFWGLASAALIPLSPENPDDQEARDCWYWLVTYEAYPNGGMTGPSQELEVAVLMDGTLVRPAIIDDRPVNFRVKSPSSEEQR